MVLLRLHTQLLPIYLIALLPYFWRLLNSDAKRTVWLGVLVANSFVFVAYADNLILAPVRFALQLTYFNLAFVSYGVTINRVKETFGRSALLLVFLWLPLEYCLNNLASVESLFATSIVEPRLILRSSILFQILIIPLLIVLLNPLLLLLAGRIISQVPQRRGFRLTPSTGKFTPTAILTLVRVYYNFPALRGPPLESPIRLLVSRTSAIPAW